MKKICVLLILMISMDMLKADDLVNFENYKQVPTVTADGGTYDIVANPLKTGINTSDSVGYYHKNGSNWQYFTMTFDSAIKIGFNNTLTFHVNASKQGRIFAKFWNNGEVLIESWAPEWGFMPTANKWIECKMDLTAAMGKEFDVLQIAACVDNLEEAEVYLDNFQLSNPDAGDGSPFNYFTVSKSMVETGDSILFDAGGSFDYDGSIVAFNWDFGDGQIDSGSFVYHTFDSSGVFSVALELKDNDNKTSIENTYVFVVEQGDKLTGLKFISPLNETNEKLEAIFHVNGDYTNVFNPGEVTVDAEITFPDSTMFTMPCFYFEKSSYAKSRWVIDGSLSCWMLRFSSAQTGKHHVVLKLHDGDGDEISDTFNITVVEGNKKGIVKNDNVNRQYYRHESGEPFYPLGINEGWDNITDYTTIINNLGQNNANIIRYWHAGFNRQALEWTGGTYQGLGYYNQEASAKMDSLLALCNKNEVYMQMVIYQHGMFSENVDANWSYSPYNIENGGLIDRAEKFFYNEACKTSVKKMLRYIIARWGYSSNIFAWEFFNEVQFTGVHNSQTAQWYPSVLKWHSEMANFIEGMDPYDHLMTTSAADNMLNDFDTIKALDVVQYHLYNNSLFENLKLRDDQFRQELAHASVINGEYGTNNEADVPFDQQRNLIWTSIMTQVPRFMWIWDHYLDVNWTGLFEMPALYLSDLDISREANPGYAEISIKSSIPGLQGIALKTEKSCYGYVFDPAHANNIENAIAKIKGLPYANYKLTWYLPVENQVIEIDSIPLIADLVNLELPAFSKGVAFKISYLSGYNLPVAIAGVDTIVSPGTMLHFNGEKSSNPSGKPLEYLWRVVSKPATSTAGISNANIMEIDFTPDVVGEFVLGLTVNDDSDTSSENTLTITVTALPVAIAGNDITVSRDIGIFVNLDGSASYDPEGNTITYAWEMVSKPGGSNGAMFAADSPNGIARFDSVGVYLVTLTVNDGITDGLPDTLVLTVTPPTGIKKPVLDNYFRVYPNPFNNGFFINKIGSNISVTGIELIDMNGSVLTREKPGTVGPEVYINLENKNIMNGVYLLKIHTTQGEVHKVVVKG